MYIFVFFFFRFFLFSFFFAFNLVISSSLSVSSHSRSTSPHIISTNTQWCDNNNNYFSLKNQSSHKCICSTQDLSMINVDNLEQNYKSSSCSSYSDTPSEEEDNLSFSRTLFTCRRHQQRRRKKKGNASNLYLVSRTSLPKNLTPRHDSFCQAKVNDNNNNNNHSTLKITHNTSITSSQRTGKWKQNAGGFQRDVLADDNNDGDEHFVRSSSPSAAVAADWFIRRQYRKQTRLKKKTGSEKKKEKKRRRKNETKNHNHQLPQQKQQKLLYFSLMLSTLLQSTRAPFFIPMSRQGMPIRAQQKKRTLFQYKH